MSTNWRFPTTQSQRIMAMPAGEGVQMVELTLQQILEDSASDTLKDNLLVPHPVVEVVDNKGSKREKGGTVMVKASKPAKVKASKVPKVKVPKKQVAFHADNGRYKIEWENTQLKAITMDSEGVFYGVQLAQTNAPLRLLLDHESMKETAQQSFKAFIHAFEDNDNPAEIELDSDGEEDVTTEEDRDTRKQPHHDASPGYASIPSQARMHFDTSQHMNSVESPSNTPETIQNVTWRRDTELLEHPQRSSFSATKIKADAVS
eukprot:scaffold166853_cov50-Attheya_sp.AAC.3